MDRPDSRSLRRRVAALLWIPGAFGAIAVGSGTGWWPLGGVALVLLVAALWLFAEGTGGIRARLRRRP